MHWKKHAPAEIAAKLTQVRRAVNSGVALSEAIKAAGISNATYFRWRGQYGNLDSSQLSVLKRLEQENARLRRALEEFEVAVSA